MKPYVETTLPPLPAIVTSSWTIQPFEWSKTASTVIVVDACTQQTSAIQEDVAPPAPILPASQKPHQPSKSSTTAAVKNMPNHIKEQDPMALGRAQVAYQLDCLLKSLERASAERIGKGDQYPGRWITFRPFINAVKKNTLFYDLGPSPSLIDRLMARVMKRLISIARSVELDKPESVVVERSQSKSMAGQRLQYRATLINGRLNSNRQKLEENIGAVAHLLILSGQYHDRGSNFLALLVARRALSGVKSARRYMDKIIDDDYNDRCIFNQFQIPGLAADASRIAKAEQRGTWDLESSPAWYEVMHRQDYKAWQRAAREGRLLGKKE
ncbi:hypothetical protein PILCRDRAFT_814979 [Piloderma croceum F 1598]|uniref:Uncharacterized protein n=1 Tax=Piloderma croceum (strain F 1598) TaxID=765440 RepID=A0A0C3BLW6_PILCF|nr:hypothetical protein PILCRDRAFT_814979 [Piloderma croceum F 1598]